MRAARQPCIRSLLGPVGESVVRVHATPDHHFVIGLYCSFAGDYCFTVRAMVTSSRSVIGEILADLAIEARLGIEWAVFYPASSSTGRPSRRVTSIVMLQEWKGWEARLKLVRLRCSVVVDPELRCAADQHGAGEKLGTVNFETSLRSRATRGTSTAPWHCCTRSSSGRRWRPSPRSSPATPSCAMANWGIALCHWGNPFAGSEGRPARSSGGRDAAPKGLQRARRRRASAPTSRRSRSSSRTPRPCRIATRTLAYARAMEAVAAATTRTTSRRRSSTRSP